VKSPLPGWCVVDVFANFANVTDATDFPVGGQKGTGAVGTVGTIAAWRGLRVGEFVDDAHGIEQHEHGGAFDIGEHGLVLKTHFERASPPAAHGDDGGFAHLSMRGDAKLCPDHLAMLDVDQAVNAISVGPYPARAFGEVHILEDLRHGHRRQRPHHIGDLVDAHSITRRRHFALRRGSGCAPDLLVFAVVTHVVALLPIGAVHRA